eukprot:7370392-Pyramimonas_sp.AAC.1
MIQEGTVERSYRRKDGSLTVKQLFKHCSKHHQHEHTCIQSKKTFMGARPAVQTAVYEENLHETSALSEAY